MMYRHSGALSNAKNGLGVNTKSRRTEVGSCVGKARCFGIGGKVDL